MNRLKIQHNDIVSCKPNRGHSTDAGIDLYIPSNWNHGMPMQLEWGDDILIDTGIKIDVPEGWAGIIFNKSGVATKKGLQVGACVVDTGYQGNVHIHLTKTTKGKIVLHPGEKVVQLIMVPIGLPFLEIHENNIFEKFSQRGKGGFGSTGT